MCWVPRDGSTPSSSRLRSRLPTGRPGSRTGAVSSLQLSSDGRFAGQGLRPTLGIRSRLLPKWIIDADRNRAYCRDRGVFRPGRAPMTGLTGLHPSGAITRRSLLLAGAGAAATAAIPKVAVAAAKQVTGPSHLD